MRGNVGFAVGGLLALGLTGLSARASSYQVINNGMGGPTVGIPGSDALGDLYVASADGVYELSAAPSYANETELYAFGSSGSVGGTFPESGPTIAAGQIIGTTAEGRPSINFGVVYNLGKPSAVAYTNLHAFPSPSVKNDGCSPEAGLVSGLFNKYYGTTNSGGFKNAGIVFAISSSETSPYYGVIHAFGAAGDLSKPNYSTLVVNQAGDLFGEASAGGANNLGRIYMLSHGANGWQEQIIYTFSASSGTAPGSSNVAIDGQGNLYGCQSVSDYDGTIFRLSPPTQAGAAWTQTILASFGPPAKGLAGGCAVTWDPVIGGLVGVGYGGNGTSEEKGVIFALYPPISGTTSWKLTTLHNFFGTKIDGGYPESPPVQIGNTLYGGNGISAAIYAVTP